MTQITLSVPQNKLLMLNNVLHVLGIKSSHSKSFEANQQHKNTTLAKPFSTHDFNKYFTWEYFSNELEFE